MQKMGTDPALVLFCRTNKNAKRITLADRKFLIFLYKNQIQPSQTLSFISFFKYIRLKVTPISLLFFMNSNDELSVCVIGLHVSGPVPRPVPGPARPAVWAR